MTGPTGGCIVVDASVAIKWVVYQPGSDEALRHLHDWVRSGVTLAAPPLLRYEAVNVLHQCVRRGSISADRALASLHALLDIPLVYPEESDRRAVQSLAWAHAFGLPAAHDAAYLALADALGAVLWTADRQLADRASEHVAVEVLAYR